MVVADQVKAIVAEHLGIDVERVTDDARFVDDLGADSLDKLELVMVFEEKFGFEIPDAAAAKIVSVRDAIRLVEGRGGRS